MYIPDLPTYLVFYFETTRGSSIDTPTTTTMTTMTTTTTTPFKSFYIPDECISNAAHIVCNHSFCNIRTSIKFTMQQQKQKATFKGSATEQSSTLLHKSSEFSYTWWPCAIQAASRPKGWSCNYNITFLAALSPIHCNIYYASGFWLHFVPPPYYGCFKYNFCPHIKLSTDLKLFASSRWHDGSHWCNSNKSFAVSYQRQLSNYNSNSWTKSLAALRPWQSSNYDSAKQQNLILFSFKTIQQLQSQVSRCLSVKTTQQLWWQLTQISWCLFVETIQQLW